MDAGGPGPGICKKNGRVFKQTAWKMQELQDEVWQTRVEWVPQKKFQLV